MRKLSIYSLQIFLSKLLPRSSEKNSNLKKVGLTRRVEHGGENVNADIPANVEDNGIPYPNCNLKFKNKRALESHIAFKHGKYAQVSSQSSGFALKNVVAIPSSQAEPIHSTDAPKKIPIKPIGSISLAETPPSDSPSTSTTVDTAYKAQACETVEITDDQPKIKRRRINHDVLFKAEVLQKKDDGMTTADLLSTYKSFNLNKTKVSNGPKIKKISLRLLLIFRKRSFFKIRPSVKYQALYKELYAQFMEARSKGYHVEFNWLWNKGRKIHRNQTGDEAAILRKHVIANFLRCNDLKQRKIQRNKKFPKEHYCADLVKWHYNLRERAIRTGAANPNYDAKWESYLPVERFSMDQSPLPFEWDTSTTYEQIEKRKKENQNQKVWAAQPKQSDSKRFCTLNICFRPSGEQPRLAIIFRRKGLHLSAVEKASWHKDADLFFQPNVWVDSEFVVNWAEKTLKRSVADVSHMFMKVSKNQFPIKRELHGLELPLTSGN